MGVIRVAHYACAARRGRGSIELSVSAGLSVSPAAANPMEDHMSAFAKLAEIRAVTTQDVDGVDELSISRADGFRFESMSMSRGDVVDLDRLLPFDSELELVLTEIDPQTEEEHHLGSIVIRSDEVGGGEHTQRFEGSGARYDLTYTVI
jgi:hypothetical protein